MRYKLSIPVTAFLIILTILVITAFQAYWLRKNYREERRLFTARTNILFRETIFRLQAAKLKLDSNFHFRIREREGVVRASGIIAEKIRAESVYEEAPIPAAGMTKRTLMVSLDRASGVNSTREDGDTINVSYHLTQAPPGLRPVARFVAGIDSLQDAITVKELSERYRKALDAENIHLGFHINAFPADTTKDVFDPFPEGLEGNTVTIGITKPVSYQLRFDNNRWYLLKRISQPILVSAFLLGVTTLSFLLLYRNLKQQQKLARLKNDFISNMTHELKTPIATVSVAIEALRSFDALEDLQRTNEYLDISANEMQRLSMLVDKVLKLSMFENREITLNKEQFDLRDLARGVLVSMKLQFEQKKAATALKTTGHNFIITADKLHMTSVLYNLLDNALKYSTGEPDILIHIIDHKQYIEIRVADNGIGIEREYKNKIFEKFFRVPSGNRHNIKGYGLGLSYVAHIVQRHMGFIEVESEVNKGSTFSVKLPFAEAPVIQYNRGRVIKFKTIG
ncbi:HAMP domain-containing sensor histidine kinase [uncultured Chitinophaga sp.]|uniref:sensor histidine kinase n=1 Tax=uncultured Chitinophaga sp. TaxID=339340 RepID=UPI0026047B22|nr:HAMP domain-containing sensor histidine kinase [uncultured Chitinophaga sp.]